MSIGKDGSQRPVPTLTEVVQLPSEAAGAGRNPTNPVVTPTLRRMSIDDTKKAGNDAARNRLATALPPPTLPPVLAPGHLPVASSPIAMPSPVFAPAPEPGHLPAASSPIAMPSPTFAPAPEPEAPLAELPVDETVVPPFLVAPVDPVDAAAAARSLPEPGSAEESRLVERVLADVQQRIDLLLEHRLREALAPAFERLAQVMLDETREAMGHSLREILASSVARELERARIRNE